MKNKNNLEERMKPGVRIKDIIPYAKDFIPVYGFYHFSRACLNNHERIIKAPLNKAMPYFVSFTITHGVYGGLLGKFLQRFFD